jgi:hypothetical protein
MGNTLSKLMDALGKRLTTLRKGSPRTRKRMKIWKHRKDIETYKIIRGDDYDSDELFETDEQGVQVVQL